MAPAPLLLEGRELRFCFGARTIGPHSLVLREGEWLALTGPSGSGKSSLLRALAKLDARAEGVVLFRGIAPAGNEIPGFRRKVVYISQTPPRLDMTAKESLTRTLAIHGEKLSEQPLDNMLSALHLPRSIVDTQLSMVSGGEAKRLHLLRALLLKPEVLLLDEPEAGLDRESVEHVLASLKNWKTALPFRAGVVVSHDHELLARFTTRSVELLYEPDRSES